MRREPRAGPPRLRRTCPERSRAWPRAPAPPATIARLMDDLMETREREEPKGPHRILICGLCAYLPQKFVHSASLKNASTPTLHLSHTETKTLPRPKGERQQAGTLLRSGGPSVDRTPASGREEGSGHRQSGSLGWRHPPRAQHRAPPPATVRGGPSCRGRVRDSPTHLQWGQVFLIGSHWRV